MESRYVLTISHFDGDSAAQVEGLAKSLEELAKEHAFECQCVLCDCARRLWVVKNLVPGVMVAAVNLAEVTGHDHDAKN